MFPLKNVLNYSFPQAADVWKASFATSTEAAYLRKVAVAWLMDDISYKVLKIVWSEGNIFNQIQVFDSAPLSSKPILSQSALKNGNFSSYCLRRFSCEACKKLLKNLCRFGDFEAH